jgi:hypothetical protein
VCPAATVTLDVNIPGSPSGPLKSIIWKRTSDNTEARNSAEQTVTNLSLADNGTYSVTYIKEINGTEYESAPADLVVNMKICPPTFATKPAVIVEPDTYAEAVLNAPDAAVAADITGYEWFFEGRLAMSTEVSTIDVASSLTFRLLKEGTYKVRARSAYGNSDFSEVITITKVEAPDAFTRADLTGTYDVADWKRTAANTYTLTIEADPAHADSVIITGMGGNRGSASAPWYFITPLKAGVTFTTDGKSTGDYGTISIPSQQKLLGGAAGTTTSYFRQVTNWANPPACGTADVVVTIKFVGGKPGVSQTGVNYGFFTTAANCSGINNCNGARTNTSTDVVTWTKQ